jgi:hypothetical protein
MAHCTPPPRLHLIEGQHQSPPKVGGGLAKVTRRCQMNHCQRLCVPSLVFRLLSSVAGCAEEKCNMPCQFRRSALLQISHDTQKISVNVVFCIILRVTSPSDARIRPALHFYVDSSPWSSYFAAYSLYIPYLHIYSLTTTRT